jgi:hypothetical protein
MAMKEITEDEWYAFLQEALSRGETLIDLGAFHKWVEQQKPTWEQQGLHPEIRPPSREPHKNAMYIDFESATVIARLTVWDSGEWELGVAYVASDGAYNSHYWPAHSLEVLIDRVSADLQRTGVTR